VNAKTALIMVLLIVVLFAVAVVAGNTGDDGDSKDDSALVDGLGDLAGDPSAVPRENIGASCVDENDPDLLLVPGGLTGGCTLVVANDEGLRLVRLRALDPFSVSAPAPEGDLDADIDADIDANKETAVAVGEGETEIDLSCDASECRVRLVRG